MQRGKKVVADLMREDEIVAGSYRLVKKLGRGGFGEIWSAVHEITKEEVAIKFEEAPAEKKRSELFYECNTYIWLHSSQEVISQGIPQIYYFGTEFQIREDETEVIYRVMVMELLGKSVSELYNLCSIKWSRLPENREKDFENNPFCFSLKTVIMIAIEMLNRIEFIHSRRMIHRDIKPDNFAIGRGADIHKIYILDYGLSKKYMDSFGNHIPYKENKSLVGTPDYSSINTHKGIEQSRRDDLESLLYVWIRLLTGKLPWFNTKMEEKKRRIKILMDKETNFPPEKLCYGIPQEFLAYCRYCRKLEFDDKPDYKRIRKMFLNLYKLLGHKIDYKYDWTIMLNSEDISNTTVIKK